ncbi:MAG TPA: DEAD/DEAH box helicase [Burkholderiaceae bacterium]|nr:DEAD/DEAH box helicase [Burkholderiaceae bacterium]
MSRRSPLPRLTGHDSPYAILPEQVHASFEATALQLAEALIPGVRLQPPSRPGLLQGQVQEQGQGDAGESFEVSVQATPTPSGMRWYSQCTCPVEMQCAHAAALLRVAMRQADSLAPDAEPAWGDKAPDWPPSAAGAREGLEGADALFYSLHPRPGNGLALRLYKSRRDGQGLPVGLPQPWMALDDALAGRVDCVSEADLRVLRTLRSQIRGDTSIWMEPVPLPRFMLASLLPALLRTRRAGLDRHWLGTVRPALQMHWLRPGETRHAALHWHADATGRQHPVLSIEAQGCHVAAGLPPWYLDPASGEAGPVEVPGLPAARLADLLGQPPLSSVDASLVASTLADVAPTVARPLAPALRRLEAPLVPLLRLSTVTMVPAPWAGKSLRGYKPAVASARPVPELMSWARLSWSYLDLELPIDTPSARRSHVQDAAGEWLELCRDEAAERDARMSFESQGFCPAPSREALRSGKPPPEDSFILQDEAAWNRLMAEAVPAWRAQGWRIEWDREFVHGRYQAQQFFSDLRALPVDENGTETWSLELGIEVQGRRLALAPLLVDLLQREPRWYDAALVDALPDTEPVILFSEDHWRIEVAAGRIKPIVRTLIDLFDTEVKGALVLSSWDLLALDSLQSDPHWAFKNDAALHALAEQLRASQGVQPVAPPAGLRIELRAYQQLGLAWLQFLREHRLAGILADDMGLGKTAQTLAHVLLEKQSGRLDRPALVILPTSLVFNWQAEARRIAPDLRVLVLHGKERAERFESIPQHDLVLTTYPLVWRDIDVLKEHQFHLLVLDEAQTVKNRSSRGADAVRQLRARHRLCLTGTPLENHLGELWTQFDFLLPGLLGNAREFTRRWRQPIEKLGQTLRAQVLAARIRPFVLRRRKEDVARELPPKTEVVRRVALEGAQRDLYETVRAVMDEQVRKEIASKGLARSHIMLLDALLKLRQVCCDPHLLKKRTLPEGIERAKLDALSEMVIELVDEGRRILVFSQFAEMLALISQRLVEDGIGHALLTGRTRDRQAVVEQFQGGAVPVFLISLKAGGVGLNLTAADTVIHFDPWWNPAAETQATDRAHRIGQDKPVFVYKLVAAGSIEERILALQQRKAQLAEAVLGRDDERAQKFTQEDIEALLAPLG